MFELERDQILQDIADVLVFLLLEGIIFACLRHFPLAFHQATVL